MDKCWITKSINSKEYLEGVAMFIKFAVENKLIDNKIYCPCVNCFNMSLRNPNEVELHLRRKRFSPGYINWIFHGEKKFSAQINPSISLDSPSNSLSSNAEMLYARQDDIGGFFHDVIGVPDVNTNCLNNKSSSDGVEIDHTSNIEPEQGSQIHDKPEMLHDDDHNRFQNLLHDCDKELYPGCVKFSKVSFILRLYHLKCLNGWSAKSFSMLLELLIDALPEGACLPSSYYETKKLVKELGLGYQKIHACPNDCMLYWDDHDKDLSCDVCNEPRYIKATSEAGVVEKEGFHGKEKPAKVLRYFSIIPRLKRLFRSPKIALSMRWHEEARIKDGKLRHPADALAWKSFDAKFPDFASDPRNVRLGLASDGFNPFRTMSTTYSTWPVVLVPYNMEPWACMKQSSIILSSLIPDEKGPGNDIDIYLKPLISELQQLWEGVTAYDAYTKQNFKLRAALLWTINDFPAYANLSGWSTKGRVACPCCLDSTHSRWLTHGSKFSYTGHRKWLDPLHPFRFQAEQFDGMEELQSPPITPSGVDIERQLSGLKFTYGKAPMRSRKRQRDETSRQIQVDFEIALQEVVFEDADDFIEDELLNADEIGDESFSVARHLWKKRSIFFDLPYWKYNILRHNLDVMHIEKNVCDNLIGTLLNIDGKSKDNLKARLDLKELGIRHELHPVMNNGKLHLPPACYTMTLKEKDYFLSMLKNLKVPDGYASNISRCVNLKERKLSNLKSHDGHILLQDILPIALRASMSKPVVAVVSELSSFFKSLCSKSLVPSELDQLESRVALTLCHMEKIFPPSFFTIMVHLVIHLVAEAKMGGPVMYRWMYPIERHLGRLKSLVKNKAHPEGSIAEGYIADELLNFVSLYFNSQVETLFNRPRRNDENVENLDGYIFSTGGRVLGKTQIMTLETKSLAQAHRYFLLHYEQISRYRSEFESDKRRSYRPNRPSTSIVHKWFIEEFADWLFKKVPMLKANNFSNELIAVARGPHNIVRRFNAYVINGFRFRTKGIERSRKTQNSGVMVEVDGLPYYGILTDIYELDYFGTFKVVMFRCDWVDVKSPGGMKQDLNGSILVNFSKLIHTGEFLKDDPFIFSSQAKQVFYVQDPKSTIWHHVIITKPRDLYDAGIISNNNVQDDADDDYNQCMPSDIRTNDLDDCVAWVRLDFDDEIPD